MSSSLLSSILSKTSQVLGRVHGWAVSLSSSSDPRSSILKDLQKLERTLKRIQAVLHDAEEREIREEGVKLWLEELKKVAYDADDVLDEYQYEVLRARVEGGGGSRKRKRVEGEDEEEAVSGSLSTMVVSIPDGMGDRIREIMRRFDEISEDRERLQLREGDGERRVLEAPYPAPTSHMVEESSIYGREHDKKMVMNLVFSEGMGNGISVIPIVGKGGLGKTTIAQLVYNDPRVKEYFNLTGWVCVSDDFNVTRLTKAIIESITKKSCDLTELSALQDKLKEKVAGKKVLLVLDDVWNEQPSKWESLRIPFVSAETVRIIVSCRNHSVAEIMQTVPPYHPDYLYPEQSWSLFKHYAFGGRDPEERQSRLEDIGRQIVEKCSGLPLAVKTIGSLLRHETDASWMEVLHSDLWELNKNNETLASLRLSYIRMPAHLKPCFVYCSMFPKDYIFDKYFLVRLWMAQGYIPPGGRRRMEDISDEYFDGLQSRSFFDSYFSNWFKMHDMIHDLAKSIAGNEYHAIVDNKLPDSPNKVRHLYVHDNAKSLESVGLYNIRALRTLFVRSAYKYGPMVIQKMIQFPLLRRCLRALEFDWEKKDEIPDFLGNLKHLRYLRITSLCIKRLPGSVCLLYHLQTLILECYALVELPSDLGSLTNLRHLDIRDTKIFCLPAGIEKLTNLQSLHTRRLVQNGIRVPKHLVDLVTLFISGLRNVVNIEDAKDADLKHKQDLRQLFLYWNMVACKDIRPDYEDRYLHLQTFLEKNKHVPIRPDYEDRYLHLETFPEKNKDVPIDEKREEAMLEYLQPHANLKELVINGYGGSKFPEWVENSLSLPSLQIIGIIGCENIRSLPLHFHNSLERVYISGCRQLTSIAGLHNLHSLKNLKICNCPQLRLLSEEGLPSMLRHLHIEECQQLTSLPGLRNVTSVRELTTQICPKLNIMEEYRISSMPGNVGIVDCPGLGNWCRINEINYIQVTSGNKLTISNSWVNIKQWFDDLTSTKQGFDELSTTTDELLQPRPHLFFSKYWTCSMKRSPSVFKELTIWSCTDITRVEPLYKFSYLQKLVLKDCSGIEFLPYLLLPSTLKSFIADSCEDLRYLQLEGMNQDTFEELQLVNCPMLERVSGLNCRFFPKTLRIEQCPQLQVFTEETENKGTIDVTQEKQVLNCVMIEHASSAASPIFDAEDDCEMGRFLQLAAQPSFWL